MPSRRRRASSPGEEVFEAVRTDVATPTSSDGHESQQQRDTAATRRFIEPPPFNLANCYKDSSNLTPLVFILSKGSDPTKAFNIFCGEMKFHKKVQSLSLGQVRDSA